MRRYLRIYRCFVSSALVRELEFKANFFAKIALNCTWTFFFILILLVIFGQTSSLAGWNEGMVFVLGAAAFLMNAVCQAFFFSLSELPSLVRLGSLDFVLTKPVDAQFWVSTRRFNFDQLGTLIAGLGMLAFGLRMGSIHPSIEQILLFPIFLMSAVCIFYSVSLALYTVSFWLVRVDNLFVIADSMVNLAKNPMDIYGTAAKNFFLYILPVAFLGYIPALSLIQPPNYKMLFLSLGWAAASLVASRKFYFFAQTRYGSASS